MVFHISRRSIMRIAVAGAGAAAIGRQAWADTVPGVVVYPTAMPIYEAQYAAATLGYFKDAGVDAKVIQGGSGVKAREILAAGEADISIGDITHPMQLSNHGRTARVLMPVDVRNNGVEFIIRKDLHDSGIDTLEKFAAWKRPDGRKPIIGVSSLGGTNHVWASYYMELMNLDRAVTWVGAGDVTTMLGSIKTKQIDVLVNSPSLLQDSISHGWGALLFEGSGAAMWDKYIGGKVPATAHYTLKATIDKDPKKMQAYVNALWRATQWIGSHSEEEIYGAIEPYVGSTAKASNIFDITQMKSITDYSGLIDKASYDRGAKVWFREMTGIKPIPMEDIVDSSFAQASIKAFPG
jgi:NitT/TauT family transport system substrate-binding protein